MNRTMRLLLVIVAFAATACSPKSNDYNVVRYLCDFEGAYWDSRVDSNVNGDNLPNNEIPTSWHDAKSDLAGDVAVYFYDKAYWGGLALSNHCSMEYIEERLEQEQLAAYVERSYSGENFLICNCFFGGVELRFENKTSYIESMMVANTTYSRNVTKNGYRMADPLASNQSIWIEAVGYLNGSDNAVATAKFYLYKDGKHAFEGWKKWTMTSMSKVDKIVFDIKWNGKGYNPYPAYFAIDDIKVVRQELKE